MTEQQHYDVITVYPDAELRSYARCTVAEITMIGSAERVGNSAFGPLVRYISSKQLAMTAPVLQTKSGEHDQWTVSFVLPGGKQLTDYPIPDNADITLRELAPHLAVAARWSGRWSYSSVEERTEHLLEVIQQHGLVQVGAPAWARYDPPWKPWFARRNEVLIPVTAPAHD